MGVPAPLILTCHSSFSFVLVQFITGSVQADRAEIILFPVLESRWEYLHAGKGVASSGQGSDTLCDRVEVKLDG